MAVLVAQSLILALMLVAGVLWLWSFPYPSPIIRWLLPPRARWPEPQIRDWLRTRKFHRSYLRFFYRDPERVPPTGTGMLAPADGILTSADVRDGIRYLVIALSFWDMHTQYSPVSGTVMDVQNFGSEFMDGEGRDFAFIREKPCPVQKRLVIRTQSGAIAVRLITSLAARRLELWVNRGAEVQRGQRIGRILLGSTVVLEVPAECSIRSTIGERVRAAETVVADPSSNLVDS